MKKEDVSIIIGLLLVIGSIIASIGFGFYYWYSFYIIGAFIFFGTLNYKSKVKSVYSYILRNQWKPFIIIYFIGLIFGFLVDIIYGRNIANLWHYPYLSNINNYIFPIFLYYPFGGLQVYEIFYFCKSFLSKKFKSRKTYKLSDNTKNFITNLLIISLILGLIIPVVNLFFNSNKYANEIMVIIMIFTIFSFDAIIYKLKKESILFEFIQGNKLMIWTMILSWLIAVILTEVPNTFSWEWIYYNIPFTNFEIFKINTLIFTFGWFFLVYGPVRFIDFIKIIFKLKN